MGPISQSNGEQVIQTHFRTELEDTTEGCVINAFRYEWAQAVDLSHILSKERHNTPTLEAQMKAKRKAIETLSSKITKRRSHPKWEKDRKQKSRRNTKYQDCFLKKILSGYNSKNYVSHITSLEHLRDTGFRTPPATPSAPKNKHKQQQ
ncbi:hypothetical protein ACJMK2_013728 [Sinanodonta woodiana]|uniref:Uncharacterized protein n=1 Tax=Sinanodonta woodiana TaxID=1069815 RepID=A0ABD3UZ74_SINWO